MQAINGLQTLLNMLPVLIPLFLVQVGLMVSALVHLFRHRRVKMGSVALWAVLIIVINIIGPVLYFVLGREDA
jgi:hypothetical protein